MADLEDSSAFAMYQKTKPLTKSAKRRKGMKLKKEQQKKMCLLNEVTSPAAKGNKIKQKLKNRKEELQNKLKDKKNKKETVKEKKQILVSNGKTELKKVKMDSKKLLPFEIGASQKKSNSKAKEDREIILDIMEEEADFSSESEASCTENENFVPVTNDSVEDGKNLFKWMISPFDLDNFLSEIWEKKPLHIARKNKTYYKTILSSPAIDKMLRTENIQFTKNIDVTSYSDGKRETHNPDGRAFPHIVWDYYLNGCSIRLLNPQTYIPKLHLLNATLQEYFKCFVGANSYLTPPNSQGFAPHYDDIEAFILQLEGKKQWRVYAPVSKEETLPRVSSKNFDQDEIGAPVLEVTLQAGDMLYFPRGFIHQGVTVKDEHSLHVTISCYQKTSWADLFEELIPQTLQNAFQQDVEFRRGLPMDISDNLGLVHSDSITDRRNAILGQVKKLFHKLTDYLTYDDAVDQLFKKFMHTALPPVLTEQEKDLTVYGNSDVMKENGQVVDRVEIQLDTKVRLLRANILRMVKEQDSVVHIYHYVENSKEYQGNKPQYLEIDERLAPAVESLITTYPEYVSVENLEAENDSDKVQVASDLWELGLLMTEEPMDFME